MFFSLEPQKVDQIKKETVYDFLVLGGGPAGLNAALYAKRKGLTTAIVAAELGGQLRNTSTVDNYLGFETIDASELIDKFVSHVKSLDIPLLTGVRIASVNKIENRFHVTLEDGRILTSKTLLAALGGSSKKLGVPGEIEFQTKGVSYCATCDAPFFKNKNVVVAGGGNSAVEAALDLSKWASHVTIIHRSHFRADQNIMDKLYQDEKISVMLETQIIEIEGKDHVTGLLIKDKKTEKISSFKTDGIFIEIGTTANTSLFAHMVSVNESKEIVVDAFQATSLEGFFAAGDITNQPHRQVIISAAEGAKAALAASQLINQKGL